MASQQVSPTTPPSPINGQIQIIAEEVKIISAVDEAAVVNTVEAAVPIAAGSNMMVDTTTPTAAVEEQVAVNRVI